MIFCFIKNMSLVFCELKSLPIKYAQENVYFICLALVMYFHHIKGHCEYKTRKESDSFYHIYTCSLERHHSKLPRAVWCDQEGHPSGQSLASRTCPTTMARSRVAGRCREALGQSNPRWWPPLWRQARTSTLPRLCCSVCSCADRATPKRLLAVFSLCHTWTWHTTFLEN